MSPDRLALAAVSLMLALGGALPAAAAASNVFPLDGPHRYGSPYGEDRGSYYHRGQDLPAAEGTPIRAPTAGRVAYRQYEADGAGNYLVIHGDDGRDSVFMHMQTPGYVGPGERVTAGQVIGRVGTTGHSTGPHLHFERWTAHWYDGGHDYDPRAALDKWDRPDEPQDLVAARAGEDVVLDWAGVDESDLAGYRVYRRTVDGSYERLASTGSSSYRDSTARSDTTYYYRVKAVDGTSHLSSYSDYSTAEPSRTEAGATFTQTVDNSSARFSASSTWRLSGYSSTRYGNDYRYARPAAERDAARYRFRVPRTGDYAVYVWYPARESYSSAALFGVRTTTGVKWLKVDQRDNGGRWVSLGTFPLSAGDEWKVAVSRRTSASGAVIADAARVIER